MCVSRISTRPRIHGLGIYSAYATAHTCTIRTSMCLDQLFSSHHALIFTYMLSVPNMVRLCPLTLLLHNSANIILVIRLPHRNIRTYHAQELLCDFVVFCSSQINQRWTPVPSTQSKHTAFSHTHEGLMPTGCSSSLSIRWFGLISFRIPWYPPS
jgi:hypothetical protein